MTEKVMAQADTGAVGDEVLIDAPHVGDVLRRGEILDVIDRGGVRHYRVRWDDGRESIFFPGSDAHVVRLHDQS